MGKKKKKITPSKLTVFDKIVLGINIVASVLLLCSYLAPDTDPRDSTLIAVLGFCYQILLLINLVFVIYWICKRKWFSLISAIALLLGFNTFLSYFQFGTQTDNQQSASLRIMEYNVKAFTGIDIYENEPTQNAIIKLIKNESPQIVMFEEFATNKLEVDSTISNLTTQTGFKYNFIKYFGTANRSTVFLTGDAIFSQFPIVDTGTIPSPNILQTRSIFADIKYKGKIFRVYCLHLAAVKIQDNEKSRYLKGNVAVNSTSFIQRKLAAAFVTRAFQVSYIKKHIEKCPYPYIIAGDFNDTPNSYSVNEIGNGLKNAFIEKGSGFETTYYSTYPLHIDHMFATDAFDILSYKSIDKKISDHKPILVSLQLK